MKFFFNLPKNASDREKFLAIHDYIVLNYYYDLDSLDKGRKKQDAVSVIKNGTCVCAGYTALTSAMARYAGIPSKYILSQELNHAWNHVRIDGMWYFCDTTWDDNSEEGSNYLGHNYFLLTDYNGVNNDHGNNDQAVQNGRKAVSISEIPFYMQEDYWY